MALGKLGSYITLVSGPFHPFGGAVDIVVVQQPDGTFKSSPWYVRFGKFQGVLKSREKIVTISVNGEEAGFHMYLDNKGEAFFLHDAEGECSGVDFSMAAVSSGDEREDKMEKIEKSQLNENQTLNMQTESCQVNMDQNTETVEKLDSDENYQLNTSQIVQKDGMEGSANIQVNGARLVKRTGSRQGTILQLMFGRRSRKDKNTAGVERVNSLERAEMAADLMEMKWSTNLSMRERRGLDERSVTGELVNAELVEEEVKVQSSEADSAGLDLHDNTLAIEQEVDAVVESDSGNGGNQVETLVKLDETVDIRVVEEAVKVQPAEAGNEYLNCHTSLLVEGDEMGFRVIEVDSSNLEGQDENLLKDDESKILRVVEEAVKVHSTEASSADLYLHQSAVAENEEVSLSVVESDPLTLGVQNENLVESGDEREDKIELVNAKATGELVVSSLESGNAGLDLYDSLVTVSGETDVVVELDSVHVLSSNDGTKYEVYVRNVDADSSNLSGEDQDFVGTSLKDASVLQHVIIEDKIKILLGRHTDLNLHERSLAATEENVHVFSDCIDATSVHFGQDAVENGTQEINLVVATDSMELQNQENCDGLGNNNVFQGHVSEANPRLVTLNSNTIDLLESCSATISTESSREAPLNKLLNVSSGDVLPETMNLALDEPQQNEKCQVQKLELTDFSVKSSSSEHSSSTAVFDKFGNNINQNFVIEGSICKTQKSISLLTNELESTSPLALSNSNGLKDEQSIYGVSAPENSEELQFDFSDDEREADSEKKNVASVSTNEKETLEKEMATVSTNENVTLQKEMATVSTNDNETVEKEMEEADASDSELFFKTNPISITCTNNTRNESMARSLPNIHFDKIEHIGRLSSSLETGEVIKEKDSPKGDSQSGSNPSQIKSEKGTVNDGTVLDVPDEKSATVSPLIELSLCKHMLSEGMGEEAAREAFDSQKVTLEKFRDFGPPNLIKNDKLVVRIGGHYFPYEAAAPVVLGMSSFGETAKEFLNLKGMIRVDRVDPTKSIVQAGGGWRLWPFGFKRSKSISTLNAAEEVLDSNLEECEGVNGTSGRKKVRSIIPTSEEIASLHLKEGPNVVTFTFSTAMLGKQQVDARIFLWKWNDRIVISDVDGTITRSDVLGQFMPLVGVDWSQTGVAHLFSAIKDNGYQLLFLSARAISQAHLTRQFLFSLKQDGKALPVGPVVISPDGLFPSLYREVIRRAPHEFKISCLEAIKALFPVDCNPFYAGFGNRDTDEISYLKVGIPMGKIFIINPKGEVAVHRRVDTKSYSSLHALVNGMFPAYSSLEQEGFNDINFWRVPLPDIDL